MRSSSESQKHPSKSGKENDYYLSKAAWNAAFSVRIAF